MSNNSQDDWEAQLTPEQYRVMRQKGTEVPFSGQHLNETRPGQFICAACGARLFDSSAKYESNMPGLVGWPSFSEALGNGSIRLEPDDSLGMQRTEVLCANCGSHLGHLFEGDLESPTGKHYCINSVCLDFKPKG